MSYPVKPSQDLTWTDGSAGKVTDPGGTKKALGWSLNERPAFQFMNWLFFAHWQWILYLTTLTDQLKALQQKYTAIVGQSGGVIIPGATHSTLAAALADSAVPAGSTILVISNDTISTTVQITKNYISIEFLSGMTYTNSSAGTCIQVSSSGVRIYGGRFASFTTGISIDNGQARNFISENLFASCTTDVLDNNTTPNNAIWANITE